MASGLTIFHWRRAKSYEWVTAVSLRSISRGERTEERLLIETGDVERYNPTAPEFSGLFRELANLTPTEDAMLAFALRFGWLGQMEAVAFPPKLSGLFGDTFGYWNGAIRDLRATVEVWDALRTTSPDVPRQLRFDTPTGVHFTSWGHLQRIVNHALEEHRVIGGLARSADTKRNSARDAFILQLIPENLLAFCWLQFARAIEGDRAYLQCENCRRWFESGGGSNRADKRFCSPTCKSSAHQRKQTLARRLRREGKTLREIAAQIHTTPKTLKGWINE